MENSIFATLSAIIGGIILLIMVVGFYQTILDRIIPSIVRNWKTIVGFVVFASVVWIVTTLI